MNPTYYLSNDIETVKNVTGLRLEELESIVGRFKKHYRFGNALKGRLVVKPCGSWSLMHHFTQKIYLTGDSTD